MCGRFLFVAENQLLEMLAEAQRRLDAVDIPYTARSGVLYPTDFAVVLYPKQGEIIAGGGFWGFTNHLEKENTLRAQQGKKPLKPKAVFNTRAETAAQNPFWRESFHRRRCLVPTSGFFEWQQLARGGKQEFLFSLPGQKLTMVAGIWQLEPDEKTGLKLPHFSMLTTAPNLFIADVHDRMPVVLKPEEYEPWLTGDYMALLNRQGVELTRAVPAD